MWGGLHYSISVGRKKSNVWFTQSHGEVAGEGQDPNMVLFTSGPVVPQNKSLVTQLGRKSLNSTKSWALKSCIQTWPEATSLSLVPCWSSYLLCVLEQRISPQSHFTVYKSGIFTPTLLLGRLSEVFHTYKCLGRWSVQQAFTKWIFLMIITNDYDSNKWTASPLTCLMSDTWFLRWRHFIFFHFKLKDFKERAA